MGLIDNELIQLQEIFSKFTFQAEQKRTIEMAKATEYNNGYMDALKDINDWFESKKIHM